MTTPTPLKKKPTLATLKSFIRKHHALGNLFAVRKTDFDGMEDGVRETLHPSLAKVGSFNLGKENTLGIEQLWLVGDSRDHISPYETDSMIGYEVCNCCGSSKVLAMKS